MKTHVTKANSGRGRKRAKWVVDLFYQTLVNFDRLENIGVKFNI